MAELILPKDELRRMAEAGATADEIAERYGMKITSVQSIASRLRIKLDSRKRIAVRKVREEIRRMFVGGSTYSEICAATGLPMGHVCNHLRQMKISIPNDPDRSVRRSRGKQIQARIRRQMWDDTRAFFATCNGWPDDLGMLDVAILNLLIRNGPMHSPTIWDSLNLSRRRAVRTSCPELIRQGYIVSLRMAGSTSLLWSITSFGLSQWKNPNESQKAEKPTDPNHGSGSGSK